MVAISLLAGVALLAGNAIAVPALQSRQAKACFIIGDRELPAETQDTVTAIQGAVTCDTSTTTLSDVPDVESGGIKFSDINFATSDQQPLAFAIEKFATADPLADSDLATFQNQLNVYQATEAGIRSNVDGGLTIKAPKFFLAYQIARIKTAQGTEITDPGQTVEHLLGKVTKNAGSGESQESLDTVQALSTQLA